MDHTCAAKRFLPRVRIAVIASALALAAGFLAAGSACAAPSRAPLNPEFLAYQEALEALALPRGATEDGHGLGLIPSPVDLSHMTGLSAFDATPRDPLGYAAQYDLRTLGRVTAIRDQGSCGSCWSFAAIASLESWLRTTIPETRDFSENNLKECHGFDWGACDGGNSFIATAYFARRSGPINETNDPYVDDPVGCTSGLTVRKTVRDVFFIPDRADSFDNGTLKQAIITYGAISTDLFYSGAYYSEDTSSYYYAGGSGSNHAVALVGWDDTYSSANFRSAPPGDGAWILRNSWGTGWGDAGYFYVSYYDSRIGEGNAAFVNAVAPTTSTVYQYDPLGWITNWGYGSTTAWGANVFRATSNGSITSVGTYASTVNTGYLVQIRSSLNGTVLATKSGTWPFAGYHTVDLTTPVPVTAGQTFVVAVRYTTPGYYYPIPAECSDPGYSSAAAASAGQSYISESGTSWEDITTDPWWGDPTCNVCIKAIVGPAAAPTPPALVTNFSASDGDDAQSALSWKNPSDSDLAQVVVQRKTGSYPTSHTNGTTVYNNASPTPGATATYSNTGLANGTTYYYAVFSRDSAGSWNDTVTAGSNADTGTPATPPSETPVGYWRLNEGSGTTAADSSGRGNDGTTSGATWTTSADGSGALSFDGVNDIVSVPDAAILDPTTRLSIEAWLRPSVTWGTGSFYAVVSKYGAPSTGYQLVWHKDGYFYLYVGGVVARSAYMTLTAGQWIHVAATYAGGTTGKIYVDGVDRTRVTATGAFRPNGSILALGAQSGTPTYWMPGTLDEVKIYNRAIAPGELNLPPETGTPPALVTNFAASDGDDAQSALSWKNPSDSDLAQVVVQRKIGSYPTSHTDGTTAYDNASPTPGATATYTHTGLTNEVTYYFAVFSRDSSNNWNDTVTAGSNADTGTPAAPPSETPVGYWRLDEGSGTIAADSSGNANDGTINGATWTTSIDASGALSFDGGNDVVSIPDDASLDPATGLTIEAWLRPSTTWSTGSYYAPISKYATPSTGYQFVWHKDGYFYLYVGGVVARSAYMTLTAGQWIHVAATYAGGTTGKIYVDGVDRTRVTATGAFHPNGSILALGAQSAGPTYWMPGTLDEVRIYNRAITPDQFNLPPAAETPTGYWQLNEGSGTSAGDSSGNRNDGTISGASWTTSTDGSGALSFDGVNDYVSVSDDATLDATTGLSIETWLRPDVSWGTGSFYAVVSKYTLPSTGYQLVWHKDGYFYLYVGGVVARSAYLTLDVGVWVHIAATYAGGTTGKIYVDGVDQTRVTATGVFTPNSAALVLGSQSYGLTYPMPGTLDEVRIYRRAIAPDELNLPPPPGSAKLHSTSGPSSLSMVFPNPARGDDEVTFVANMKGTAEVRIEVYDVSGKLLMDSGWVEGPTWSWLPRAPEGSGLASGVYIYILHVRGPGDSSESASRGTLVLRP